MCFNPPPMRILTLALLCALVAPLTSAQTGSPLDARTLDGYFDRDAKVEVNLRGSLLRLAVEATRDSEPEVAELVNGLNSVTVRIYELDTARGDLTSRISDIGNAFEDSGWFTFVRVRGDEDDPEDVWVYVREDGDLFGGMAVMSLDHEDGEAIFVVIDGLILAIPAHRSVTT